MPDKNKMFQMNDNFIQAVDRQGILDFSYLNEIKPYDGDHLDHISGIDVQAEIAQLESEMSDFNIDSIPFRQADFVVIFLAGILGGTCDVILGKPANAYGIDSLKPKEPKITNNFLKQYDLKTNPIDKAIPGASVGNHRIYSDGHDLVKFFKTVNMMFTGTGKIGVAGTGGKLVLEQAPSGWMESLEKLSINPGDPSSYIKLSIVLALHLYKDYCSARSLPIPGSSILSSLNHNEMPSFMNKLTNDMELNLRTINGQILSVVTIEIINGIYSFIVKNTEEGKRWTKEQHKHKKEKMLLLSHSIALMFNVGKVVVTENPAFINFPQIIRIVTLAWKIINQEIQLNHKSIEKLDMSVLKTQLETVDTLILLDQSVYYTKEIDRIIVNSKQRFDEINTRREFQHDMQSKEIFDQSNELNNLMQQLKTANDS
ncbi:MAG TPA: hypothetical protein VFC62_04280 [Atopostipes sp.]|nr:hypothetical protein [Atopostipes sp.]